MLFGNQETFGIEYEIEPTNGGAWLFGKICYWIDGARVGDYSMGTSLRDVLFQSESILRNCHNRSGTFYAALGVTMHS